MSTFRRLLIICLLLILPATAVAGNENEDDKKDRRATATLVLNLTEEVDRTEAPVLRSALMEIEGVRRVHVCSLTQTVTIEFEENRSRCARRILGVVSDAGFQAVLRDRVLLPGQEADYRTAASPAINASPHATRRPQVIQARRNY